MSILKFLAVFSLATSAVIITIINAFRLFVTIETDLLNKATFSALFSVVVGILYIVLKVGKGE